MPNNRNLFVVLLLTLSAAPCLWAGKEFTAGPGESTLPDQLIVKLHSGANINQLLASVVPQAFANLVSSQFNAYVLQLPPGIQSLISKALAASPLVDYVEPNRLRKSNIGPPNDPSYASQWALSNIQAIQAWNYLPDQYLSAATAGTNRVKVAVLDTGADCTHPDFKNLGGSSTDSALGGQLLFASSQALVATKVASPACAWQDDHGHGTHTAGIVAAATQNGTGVASVGYALQVIVYKVLDNTGSGSDSVIAQAIEAATDAGAKVVSMSLGGAGYSQSLQNAIDYAWQHNTLVVSAAGNTGDNQLLYPGAANHALGVAATDTTNTRASFSTYGNWVKIAAPGVNVLSTAPTYANTMGILNYATLSGTSMATPHVAAVAGLVYMANPSLSAAAVAQRLQRSAQTPNAGWDQFIGYGVLNAAGAVSGTLRPASLGSLTGQVVDGSNFPITGATVIANGQSFTTASDGLFRIANLSAATYTLNASAAGFSTVTMQAAVLGGSDTMLTVQMGVTLGEFTGTVTSNGLPVAGAVVEAISGGLIQGTAVSDANGAYAVYLPSGTYDLTGSAPGDINSTVTGQVLSTGLIKTVNLTISRLGNIAGTVKDLNGTPVATAHIDVANAGFSLGATADASGNFSTAGIPSGTYTVTASSSGFTNVSLAGINVSPNVSTPVTLQFSTAFSPLPAGLIGYWNFDEGSGTIAHDTSGSGYNGAINGATWRTGKINSALNFGGTTNEVVTSGVALGATFSVSAWVNPAVAPQGGYVRIAETRFDSGLYLGTNASGAAYKFIVNGASSTSGSCGLAYGCAEGGLVASGWHLVAATFDGTTAKLYVDNALVASDTFIAPLNTNLPFYIGQYFGGGSGWNGGIDEVRLYNRALTGADLSAIYSYTGAVSDSTPPSTPANVSATAVSVSQINVSWSASTDNVGVTGYRVFRNGGLAGTVTTLSYPDSGLAASTTYSYTVAALDAAGNVSNMSLAAAATTFSSDTTPPSVSITAPLANTTVSNTITVTATASDNVAVGDVQFQLDGVNLGADLTAAPYSISWDTTTAGNGSHTLTAIARDTSHNTATSAAVPVTVSNTATGPPTVGLVGYWNFDEASGSVAHDTSGSGHNGAVTGAAWTTGKINSGLSFNGATNDVVTSNIALGATVSVSAWVNPAVTTQGAYVRIAETQYGAGFYLGTNASGTKYKFIVNGASGTTGACGLAFGCAEGGTVSSGWHLVTATFDGASAKLYVDNALAASDTFNPPSITSLPLYIAQYYGGGYGWNGMIDEVRLYNRALTSTEVSAIYNYTGGDVAGGLVGYWNFDEGAGVIAHDTSGSGFNGAVTGAAWTTGKINSGLSFNGATNSVVTPNIALGATFSVSTWVNPAVTTQSAYVRIAETQYGAGFYLGTNASGTKYKFIVNGASGTTGACGLAFGCAEGGTVTSGWHLVTATFDGATAKLYVDTALVASDTFNPPSITNLPLYIAQYYGGGYGWNGAIDEVRLYNRALTAADVVSIFNR